MKNVSLTNSHFVPLVTAIIVVVVVAVAVAVEATAANAK